MTPEAVYKNINGIWAHVNVQSIVNSRLTSEGRTTNIENFFGRLGSLTIVLAPYGFKINSTLVSVKL
jgi:hypothetical protein